MDHKALLTEYLAVHRDLVQLEHKIHEWMDYLRTANPEAPVPRRFRGLTAS